VDNSVDNQQKLFLFIKTVVFMAKSTREITAVHMSKVPTASQSRYLLTRGREIK
jgi:hypothetical protein